jgi:hypothetical protein
MNQVFENAYLNVINAPSSIFSKEDVIKLINELQANVNADIEQYQSEAVNVISAAKFAEFTSEVRERLHNSLNSDDIVDLDSAEFEINYDNKIELTRVGVDLDSWTEDFDTYMLDTFTEVFGDDSIIEQ